MAFVNKTFSLLIRNEVVWLILCLSMAVIPITNLTWIHVNIWQAGGSETNNLTIGLWNVCGSNGCRPLADSTHLTLLFPKGYIIVVLQCMMVLTVVWQILGFIVAVGYPYYRTTKLARKWCLNKLSASMRIVSVLCCLVGISMVMCLRNRDDDWIPGNQGIEKYKSEFNALPLTMSVCYLLVSPTTIYYCTSQRLWQSSAKSVNI